MRLPGRHPKRAFWPEISDGNQWLSGKLAVEFILALTADSPNLIPDERDASRSGRTRLPKKLAPGAAFFLPDTASKSPVLARAKATLTNWKTSPGRRTE